MPESLVLRRCCHCKTEKPIDQFRKSRNEICGRGYECKYCVCEAAKRYYYKNRETLLHKNKLPENRVRKLLWERKYRETKTRRSKIRSINFVRIREKVLAKRAIYNAVKSGKLIRPDNCSICHIVSKIEAHHYLGYAVENRLNVEWLCHRCHMAKHRIQNPLEHYSQIYRPDSF